MSKTFTIGFLVFLLSFPFEKALSQFAFYNEKYTEGKFTVELNADAGGMNCLTDLGGNKGPERGFIKDLNLSQTHVSYGLSAALNYRRMFSLRAQFVKGEVSANDNLLKHSGSAAQGRYRRNLNFYSTITEASAIIECYPMLLFAAEGSWLPAVDWYLFAGLAFFHFSPRTRYDNQEIELWNLHTEGQGFDEHPERMPYRRHQLNLPFGSGIKFELLPLVNLRMEIHARKLFTDYLDDVSSGYVNPALFVKYLPATRSSIASKLSDRRLTPPSAPASNTEIRGNSRNNDSFFSISARISFVLGRQRTL